MHLRTLPKSDSFLLKVAILVFIASTVWLVVLLSSHSQVESPTTGGTLIEGVVGTPRFVNPVLAVTRADKDLTYLIYDGLMKLGSEGVLIPNIAKSITVSEDGLIYNVVLRDDVVFHDEVPLTADDVVFTVSRIQNPAFNSPLRANFDRVVIEQLGEHELNFILPEPYALFTENLTFGIMPKHVWKDATNEEFPFSQHNSEPIGSGPYKVSKISRNTSGIPESYILEPHTSYHNGVPKIESLTLKFYSNEEMAAEALKRGEVNSVAGLNQSTLQQNSLDPELYEVVRIPLPRTFALFFNQNKSAALRDSAARRALDASIDRKELIDTVLGGYGRPLTSPIPPGFGIEVVAPTSTGTTTPFDQAREILKKGGWKLNDETGIWEKEIDDVLTPLTFSIATANSPIFETTAEFLRKKWEQLGVSITVKQFEQSDLTQAVIRPRDYESLLFGTELGRSLDFYPFWHSSQRNDPGLNVALYANITTDSILGEIRTNADQTEKKASLLRFAEEIDTEIPALFFYTPEFLYVFPKGIVGEEFSGVDGPSERFASIEHWYIDTESVWPVFAKDSTKN